MKSSDFELLSRAPGLRNLFDLTWRIFKVNLALVSPDGDRTVCYDVGAREAPFCRALHGRSDGKRICLECDMNFFRQAIKDNKPLRYRCHAGLTEFIVPVIRQGQVIALLQCGQVLDSKPSEADSQNLRHLEINEKPDPTLMRAFLNYSRVLPPSRQNDLILYLNLVAGYLASAECPLLATAISRVQETIGRIMTYIEGHLTEELALEDIAKATAVSLRTLSRWFHKETGMTVLEFILRRRIALVCHYLATTDQTSMEIAFAVGFQSVQNFNRAFRKFKGMNPKQWRSKFTQPRPTNISTESRTAISTLSLPANAGAVPFVLHAEKPPRNLTGTPVLAGQPIVRTTPNLPANRVAADRQMSKPR